MSVTPAKRRRQARMRSVVELREKGWSLRAIAAHLGVDPETVRRDLKASQFTAANATPSAAKSLPQMRQGNVIPFDRKAS
ncbi:MAG TPA: helix-turn-helix domain-containing protein [Gaiellales bacterium]|nr:helix-turn-helix domain-containing protein [Gaiellales bacterium]